MPEQLHLPDTLHHENVPKSRSLCGVILHAVLLVLLASGVVRATATTGAVTAQVSNMTVPAGGTAQIRVSLESPQALVSGEVVMDLDPKVFGDIAAADVFSATGDQVGSVSIQGLHLDAQFTSHTGGLGRLPGVPILTVAVPVLASVAEGAVSIITFQPGSAPWTDVQHVQYSVTVIPGTLTVGGSLSVQDVVPGGGLLPAGTVVRIDGTGFTPATTLQIDGVSVASTQFVNSQEVSFTLGAPADLTGKRLLLSNPDGTSVDYFSGLRGTFVTRPTSGPFATVQPIFPLQTYAAAAAEGLDPTTAVALENQTTQPVVVIFRSSEYLTSYYGPSTTVTLPPASIYVQSASELGGAGYRALLEVLPAVPIRMALVDPTAGASLISPEPVPVTQFVVALDGSYQPGPLSLNWQIGTSAPAPMKLVVVFTVVATPFTVSATTASGGRWLSVSPAQGTTCTSADVFYPPYGTGCSDSSKFTATVNPSNLRAGVYQGSITVTPGGGFNPQPTVVPVILTVSTLPTILVGSSYVNLYTPSFGVAPPPASLKVTTNGSSAAFSVSFTTHSGRNWLSVTPGHGTTPASLTVTADPKLLPGLYDYGAIMIAGPRNTQTIPVEFGSAPPPQAVTATPASLQFFAQAGFPAPLTQRIDVPPGFDPFSISFQTTDGAKWLQPVIQAGPGTPYLNVSVDPTGLKPGTYHGSIVISSALAAGPATVPVTLTVWTGSPPAVTVAPSSLTFTAPKGSATAFQTLNVSTGNLQLETSGSISTADGNNWLSAVPASSEQFDFMPNPTPTTVSVSADATNLAPGTYHGTITITAPIGSTNSAIVPVTFTVTPALPALPPVSQAGPPLAVALVNAASQNAGAVAPGEIFTIFGQNIGPDTPAGFTLDANGKVTTNLNGARVLFNGIAAPLLYAQSTQVNAIVPYEVALSAPVTIQVEWNGARGIAVGVPVASTAPAVFTLDSGGAGRAAVLNQDDSVNDPANPAARGSIIQIFGTGEGLTSPPGNTGEVTGSDIKKPVQPVTLSIGGVDAFVTYSGSAPDAVAGLFQVNAVVPQSVTPGPTVPILLTVGTAHSQMGVTVAVK